MMHTSQFQKIDPYDWFCAPGTHIVIVYLVNLFSWSHQCAKASSNSMQSKADFSTYFPVWNSIRRCLNVASRFVVFLRCVPASWRPRPLRRGWCRRSSSLWRLRSERRSHRRLTLTAPPADETRALQTVITSRLLQSTSHNTPDNV